MLRSTADIFKQIQYAKIWKFPSRLHTLERRYNCFFCLSYKFPSLMQHLLTKAPFSRWATIESEITLHGILSILIFLSVVIMDILSKFLDQVVVAVYCALIPLMLMLIISAECTTRELNKPKTNDFLKTTKAPGFTTRRPFFLRPLSGLTLDNAFLRAFLIIVINCQKMKLYTTIDTLRKSHVCTDSIYHHL